MLAPIIILSYLDKSKVSALSKGTIFTKSGFFNEFNIFRQIVLYDRLCLNKLLKSQTYYK